ncbi:MAG: hypothetical protein Q8O93_01600 [bacterium]|nr:hypothetical protein [bacterium]
MTLTPEQFNKIVTKEILKEDLKELEERLGAKIDKKMDEVLTAVDGIAKKHEDFKTEMVANQGAHDRFEVRIKGLEKKQGVVLPA